MRSWVVAHVPETLDRDLKSLKASMPTSSPNAPILPYMDRNGRRAVGRVHDDRTVRAIWDEYKARHGIESWVRPCHVRHWVKRVGRRRLDTAILAYWSGHDPRSEGGGMSAHYGTKLEHGDVLKEQRREWPDGPMGDLTTEGKTDGETNRLWEAIAVLFGREGLERLTSYLKSPKITNETTVSVLER